MVADQRTFDEAILLSRTRLKLPDLLHGAVEKITIATSSCEYERPWSINGGFATVYKFRTQDGRHKALRCFRVSMRPEIKDRYAQFSGYFGALAPDITAGFHYYDDGISIDEVIGGVKKRRSHPVILMDWIDGVTLLEKVDTLCQHRDQGGLAHLCEQWLILLDTMRNAHIAHGDLSGENVMIRNDGRLVLVDYDSIYIPPFQGLPPLVSGQPNYQHPDMHQRAFDEHMDDFSGCVIFIALRSLQVRPELWDTYAPRGKLGQLLEANLLFTHNDFLHPGQS
jgi:serine/threonine protein kinase